jgi:hypothetical protein
MVRFNSRLWIIGIILTLTLSSLSNVQAQTWLFYDYGSPSGQFGFAGKPFVAVRFSLPSGWSNVKILTARYYATGGGSLVFRAHVFGSDGITPLLPSSILVSPSSFGWVDVDLSSYDIFVSGDFYIAMEQLTPPFPAVGIESIDPPSKRSFSGEPGSWILQDTYDMLIRAEVDRVSPVGGVASPVNKIEILTPYLALAGLIIAVSTVYVIKKRKD